MWRRMAWDGKIHRVDRVLVKYRQHGTNLTRNYSLQVQALAMHFSKLLDDTPARLHHMFPAAKFHFFQLLRFYLAAEGVPLHANMADRVGQVTTAFVRAAFHAADKMSFGLLRAGVDKVRGVAAQRGAVRS
jgi:hypothetical protein